MNEENIESFKEEFRKFHDREVMSNGKSNKNKKDVFNLIVKKYSKKNKMLYQANCNKFGGGRKSMREDGTLMSASAHVGSEANEFQDSRMRNS